MTVKSLQRSVASSILFRLPNAVKGPTIDNNGLLILQDSKVDLHLHAGEDALLGISLATPVAQLQELGDLEQIAGSRRGRKLVLKLLQ